MKKIAMRGSNLPALLKTWALTALVLVLGLTALPARAQQDVGTISGVVTDPAGSLVPNAKVHVSNNATGIAQDIMTNGEGYFETRPISPGRYTMKVSMQGFASITVENIVVDAAAHVSSPVQLQVGSVETSVSVESRPPALDTVDAQVGNTVDTRAAQDLPVNGRSVLALATISPGVESAVGATSEGFTNRGTQASAIRISGGVPGGNNNLLDGVTNLQNYLGEVAINLKSDSIQEFRIMTGVIPAQFGYTSGGVINVISRAGSNQFHGSVYEFFRNDALDAAQAIPRPAFGKPELRFNNYGGTFGGPIKKDKAFFFGNYEEYRFVNGSPQYTTVPTDLERGGDFSDLGREVTQNGQTVCYRYPQLNPVSGANDLQIYNPSTGTTTVARQPYANNKLTSIDPVALAAENLFYPHANNTVGSYDSCTHANNYYADPKLVSNERTGLARVDYQLSGKDSFVARYAYYQNYTNNGSGGFGPLFFRNDTLTNQNAMLSETHVFSATLVNDARVSVLRSDFPFIAATAYQNYAAKLGLPNDNAIVSPIFNNGVTALNGTVGFRASTTIELVDDATKTIGNHTFHAGFDGRMTEGYNNQSGNASGGFNFSAAQTAAGNNTTVTSGTGNQYASFLVGAVQNASVQLATGTAWRKWQYVGYLQDDWHVNQRLTFNLGLRYDYQAQPYEKNNGIDDFDITRTNSANGYLGAVRYAGVNGEGSNFVKENWNDWGPRIGFALVLTSDNKTVARGGYAIYYPTTAQASYDQAAGNPNGFGNITTSYNSSTSNGPAFQLSSGFPYAPSQPLGAAGGQNAFLGQTGYYILPNAKDPTSQVYTLTISRELPLATVLDVTYLGNRGDHFNMGSQNINVLNPSYFSLGTAYLNTSVANPYAGLVPGSLGAATITRANLLKPYPYMSSVQYSNPRLADYDANYLYVSATRRAEHGLQIIGAYTYGKVMSLPIYTDIATTTGISQTGGSVQQINNINADYTVDAIDVTHRGVLSALYDLPFGKGKRFLGNSNGIVDRLIGGLQFNTIMTVESGRPLQFGGASNQGIATRPNFNPGVSVAVASPNKNQWFNPAAFIDPPDYSYGNVPRYYSKVRGPGVLNFDMSAFKTTKITERTSLELRLEGYNVFNRTNLGMPNTSFSAGAPANPSNPYAEGGSNTNSNFGKITSSGNPRNVQLGAKLRF